MSRQKLSWFIPVFFFFILILSSCGSEKGERRSQRALEQEALAEYVGRETCKECHKTQYELFQGSDHDMAMDTATEETVLGDFNDVVFDHLGVRSRFYRSGAKFMVETEGPDGELTAFEVHYVFGIRPLQQYLVPFPGGSFQCLPLCWDTRPAEEGGQKWFHIYGDERIAHDDPLHWTHISQNWNYMCAECHSTNLRKNYSYASKTYNTVWDEIDVSCEACHGPSSKHLDWAWKVEAGSSPEIDPDMGLVLHLRDTDNATWIFDPDSTTARRSVPRESDQMVQMCSRCHSRRGVITEDYYHGGSLLQTHWPALLTENLYYPDGQIQDEVYVYASFMQSKMYQEGVVCKDCHEPHSGKVYVDGNALCYRCHLASEYGAREHHFHDPGKEGASCMECHMHENTYMQIDPRRDHSIRIPRPDLSDKLGTPNSCIQCHDEKSNQWATDYLERWYGKELIETPHYGETFHAARRRYPQAASELLRLGSSKEEAPMVRATAIYMLQDYPGPETFALLRSTIVDPDPLIRFASVEVLQVADHELIAQLGIPCLDDPVKMVRIRIASVLTAVPANLIPEPSQQRLQEVLEEYNASLMINADHPTTHMNIGNLFLNAGELGKAEASYLEAMDIEPGLVGPYINLTDLYRRLERDDEGEAVLLTGLEHYPELAPLHYSLGLLKARQNQYDQAMSSLEKAMRYDPADPHYGYVYAIALNSSGQKAQALKVLYDTEKLHPYDQNILYTIASISLESGDVETAKIYLRKLVEYYPEEAAFQQGLTQLGG